MTPADGVWRCRVNAKHLECRCIHRGQVTRHMHDRYGSLHRDLIQIVSSGVPPLQQQRVIVTVPHHPAVGPRGSERFQAREQLGHGGDFTDGRTV